MDVGGTGGQSLLNCAVAPSVVNRNSEEAMLACCAQSVTIASRSTFFNSVANGRSARSLGLAIACSRGEAPVAGSDNVVCQSSVTPVLCEVTASVRWTSRDDGGGTSSSRSGHSMAVVSLARSLAVTRLALPMSARKASRRNGTAGMSSGTRNVSRLGPAKPAPKGSAGSEPPGGTTCSAIVCGGRRTTMKAGPAAARVSCGAPVAELSNARFTSSNWQ